MGQYRRVSKDLHDRCLRACWDHKEKLTEDEGRILSAVAAGWAGQLTVTKQDFVSAKEILARIEETSSAAPGEAQ